MNEKGVVENSSRESYIVKLIKICSIMLFGKSRKLTAEQANIISRFNLQGYTSLEDIANKKILEIEDQIKGKLQFSHREKLLALIVPDEQKDLYDIIKNHYEEKGFKTFYLDKERVPEFKNSTYLFISWDIDIIK